MSERDSILDTLSAFIEARGGMQARDYIRDWRDTDGRRAYAADRRQVLGDLQDARALLAYVRWHPSIDADALCAVMGSDRRLTYDRDRKRLHYTTGQYFPTEYRKAVCSALASAIWVYLRDNGADTGDAIRAAARRDLPRRIARRYFA